MGEAVNQQLKRVAIVGSRDYPKLSQVRDYVQELPENTVVVSGGARGVDSVAETSALSRGLEVIVFLPDWKKYGKCAGFLRNQDIVDMADVVVVFWDGVSNGTEDTMRLTEKANKPMILHISPDVACGIKWEK